MSHTPLHSIEVCRPTTSSAKDEYDLHLAHGGNTLYFEVTDNVGGNNNYKVQETLVHDSFLRRIRKGGYSRHPKPNLPKGLLHLVTSEEMGNWIDENGRDRESEWGVRFGTVVRVGDCTKSSTGLITVSAHPSQDNFLNELKEQSE